jgi:hypothetical protein
LRCFSHENAIADLVILEQANAALRSIVRKDSGESYTEFLTELAKASRIETPTRADLAKIDRKRPKKGSYDDWEHPGDPTAKIMKMKDGSTHLAHKAEHVVDLGEEGHGAILAVVRHDANRGDTNMILESVGKATRYLQATRSAVEAENSPSITQELVTDKGYHNWKSGLTARNQIAVVATGEVRMVPRIRLRSTRTGDESAVNVENACWLAEANLSSGRLPIVTRRRHAASARAG